MKAVVTMHVAKTLSFSLCFHLHHRRFFLAEV